MVLRAARAVSSTPREAAWLFEQFGWRQEEVAPPLAPHVNAAVMPLYFKQRWEHSSSMAEPLRRVRSYLAQHTMPIDGLVHPMMLQVF